MIRAVLLQCSSVFLAVVIAAMFWGNEESLSVFRGGISVCLPNFFLALYLFLRSSVGASFSSKNPFCAAFFIKLLMSLSFICLFFVKNHPISFLIGIVVATQALFLSYCCQTSSS